jgi:hypothetical protein
LSGELRRQWTGVVQATGSEIIVPAARNPSKMPETT